MKHVVQKYDFIWAHYHQMNDKLQEINRMFSEKIGLIQADFLVETDVHKMTEKIIESGV